MYLFIQDKGRKGAALLMLAIMLLATGCSAVPANPMPLAKQGVLDLNEWNFSRDGIVLLDGAWQFYRSQLLGPHADWGRQSAKHVPVPKSWNSYGERIGFPDGIGFATYRLRIVLPPTDGPLSLLVPSILSAYRLFVNGKELAAVGIASASQELAEPGQYPRIVTFESGGELELVLQVSNYHHRRGGLWQEIKLGSSEEIWNYQQQAVIEQMLIFGSLAMIGFYHIGLFLLRRQERFTLYFGLLCLFIGLRLVVTGEVLLVQQFPQLTWETGLKIEYIAIALSAMAAYQYIYHLFPRDSSVLYRRIAIWLSLAMCLYVVLTPAYVYSRSLPWFQGFAVLSALIGLQGLLKARVRRRPGSSLVLIGIIIFFASVINDILYYNEWFSFGELIPVGFFLFIMTQSFILSTRFSKALKDVERVSSELRELNAHLEERIDERTEELRRSNETLEKANLELAKMEKARIRLLTNISHDLRTPMTLIQGYLEALQDGVVHDPQQKDRYIRMMLGKVNGLNGMINDLFELSKLEAGQVSLDLQQISLPRWIEQMKEHFELDVETQGRIFSCRYEADNGHEPGEGQPANPAIRANIDIARMNQVMSNLFSNALKHTKPGGHITVTVSYCLLEGIMRLRVQDDGSGISPKDLPFIFDRYFRENGSRSSGTEGSGIGLAIVKEIIELHGGSIAAESEPGKGTTFTMQLPIWQQSEEEQV